MTPEEFFGGPLPGPTRLFTGKAVKPDILEEGRSFPDGPDVVLCLQGGGARAAYQVGAYHALQEGGLEPDWVIGVSSGAINGAVIAGNPLGERLEQLDRLWQLWRSPWDLPALGVQGRRTRRLTRQADALLSIFGKPNFYWPRLDNPAINPQATSFYQQSPLRRTIRRVVNFDYLFSGAGPYGPVRLSVGCADVEAGTLRFFDNKRDIPLEDGVPLPAAAAELTTTITKERPRVHRPVNDQPSRLRPEHLMAAAAYPPGAAAVRIGDRLYWDGGVLANSPLDALLDDVRKSARKQLLVFLIDLWSRESRVPGDVMAASWRRTELEHASRISSDIERFLLTSAEGAKIEVIHLTYESPRADPTDPMDFSSAGIDERRRLGYRHLSAALADWKKKEQLGARESASQRVPGSVFCVHRYDRGEQTAPTEWNFQPAPATSSPTG
jgi:NTE family protein